MLLAPRISRGHFFLTIFFRVTHDGLSERGTTRSLPVSEMFEQFPGKMLMIRANVLSSLVQACRLLYAICLVKTELRLNDIRMQIFCFGELIYLVNGLNPGVSVVRIV